MKKFVTFWLALSLFLPATIQSVSADQLMDITREAGYDVKEINRPKSSIIVDAGSGDVLWEDNADELRDPASMSKLMTLFLVFKAIKEGKLSYDTVIQASATDQAIAGIYEISNNKIVAGVDYTVRELITMTVVPSSNATTVMLANYLSDGDADAWLDQMNQTAQELGMTNSQWNNASGAAAVSFKGYYRPLRYDIYSDNQTTARDLAILGYHFVNSYPEILSFTKEPVVTVKAGTPYEETFTTYNYSLPGAKYGLDGVDGLKTGSSPNGAFNYIATIKRGNQRLVEVIMGVGDWSDQDGEYYRHPFGNALAEKIFADYSYQKVQEKGTFSLDGKMYRLSEDFYASVKKGQEPKLFVKDGYLYADNGLTSLSSKISDGVKVEEGEESVLATAKSVLEKPLNPASWLGFVFNSKVLLLLPVLVLVLIFYLEKKRGQKRQKEKE